MVRLNDEQFEVFIAANAKPLLLVFWADWCGTCQIVTPVLQSLMKEFESQLEVGILDFDRSPQIASEYAIATLPTFLFFEHGRLVRHLTGMISKKELRHKIQQLLEGTEDDGHT